MSRSLCPLLKSEKRDLRQIDEDSKLGGKFCAIYVNGCDYTSSYYSHKHTYFINCKFFIDLSHIYTQTTFLFVVQSLATSEMISLTNNHSRVKT